MGRFLTVVGLALLASMNGGLAWACSLSEDFVRPSNFELIQMADAIVVARAVSASKGKNSKFTVKFRVVEEIKGRTGKTVYDTRGHLGETVHSDPMSLTLAHREAYSASCSRSTYARGEDYVLFLEHREDGQYRLSGHAFSRINEDYLGPDSLWMETIRYYLDVQQSFEPMEQLAVLKKRYDELVLKKRTGFEERLAGDIRNHLMSRSPHKPTEYLVQTYLALEEGRALAFSVRSPEADKASSQDELPALPGARFEGFSKFEAKEQRHIILWALAIGDHRDAFSLFERLTEGPIVQGQVVGAAVRFFAKQGQYRRAINLANAHAFRVMNNTSRYEIGQFLRGAMGLRFDENNLWSERWQSDEYARNWWPEFALAVNAAQRARFGSADGEPFGSAARMIRPQDYRHRPDVALMLADTHDKGVVSWAVGEINQLLEAGTHRSDLSYALPTGVLLRTYSPTRPEKIQALFCGFATGRHIIARYIGLHKHGFTEDLAWQLAAQELNAEDTEALLWSLHLFAGEDRKGYLGQHWWGNKTGSHRLIGKMLRGEPIDLVEENLEPLVCQ